MALGLRKAGLDIVQQRGLTVPYDGAVVGQYIVDLMVELKTARAWDEGHRAQCLNTLKASGLQLCLLLDFSTSRMEIKLVAGGL